MGNMTTKPLLNNKKTPEKFENESKERRIFYIFGIIVLILAIIGGIYWMNKKKSLMSLTSSTSPMSSKFLLTATPNYF